ncbi:SUMF1/EgtB/PvdO family nonheme iron enzyme [Candidatus Uhrbacteria bacterium]|nr:SUMF1/EgtB/PvdO family nonheme iron enzyme [Candidatus Uhrbacteria bacterium]
MDRESVLREMGFVRLEGGPVRMGTETPLPCRLEGYRHNETPVFGSVTGPFWMARTCVSNIEYERHDRRYPRLPIAPHDRHPAVNVTYLNALDYCRKLSERVGLPLTLPTEAQWVFAAAPSGTEFPWGNRPDRRKALTRGFGTVGPATVDSDDRYLNRCGLFHICGNVSQFTLGDYDAPGHGGFLTDGRYCVVRGGNWALCPWSAGVHRRGIVDVAARMPTVGFRLVCNGW